MEVYLNVIEMGDGIYGANAAAQAYFHKEAFDLNPAAGSGHSILFPNPLKWSAANPTDYLRHRHT